MGERSGEGNGSVVLGGGADGSFHFVGPQQHFHSHPRPPWLSVNCHVEVLEPDPSVLSMELLGSKGFGLSKGAQVVKASSIMFAPLARAVLTHLMESQGLAI